MYGSPTGQSAAKCSAAQCSAEHISGAEERSAAPQRSAAQEHNKQQSFEKNIKNKLTNKNNDFQTSLAQGAPEPD